MAITKDDFVTWLAVDFIPVVCKLCNYNNHVEAKKVEQMALLLKEKGEEWSFDKLAYFLTAWVNLGMPPIIEWASKLESSGEDFFTEKRKDKFNILPKMEFCEQS